MSDRVFLALPGYDNTLSMYTHVAVKHAVRSGDESVSVVTEQPFSCSLLPKTFNELWLQAALSNHRHDWFAMIHADVAPEAGWLSTLIDEAKRHEADLMSAVIRIKNMGGSTSTALDYHSGQQCLHLCDTKFLPRTFSRTDCAKAFERNDFGALLVNTGLWVANLHAPWVRKVSFRLESGIDWDRKQTWVESEDWLLSRDLYCMGYGNKVYATTAVKVGHWGALSFDNWLDGKRPAEHPAREEDEGPTLDKGEGDVEHVVEFQKPDDGMVFVSPLTEDGWDMD